MEDSDAELVARVRALAVTGNDADDACQRGLKTRTRERVAVKRRRNFPTGVSQSMSPAHMGDSPPPSGGPRCCPASPVSPLPHS